MEIKEFLKKVKEYDQKIDRSKLDKETLKFYKSAKRGVKILKFVGRKGKHLGDLDPKLEEHGANIIEFFKQLSEGKKVDLENLKDLAKG